MRTTIDIPDDTYRALKILAAERRTTVRAILLDGLELVKQQKTTKPGKFVVPVIKSSRPGTLSLTNEQIDELTAFS